MAGLGGGLFSRVAIEGGGIAIGRQPVTGRAGPAGGVYREPACVCHTPRFDKHLSGELIDEGEHLAAACGAETAIHVGAFKSQRGIGFVLAFNLDGILREHDYGSFAGSGDALAIFAVAMEPHCNLGFVKFVLDVAT